MNELTDGWMNGRTDECTNSPFLLQGITSYGAAAQKEGKDEEKKKAERKRGREKREE